MNKVQQKMIEELYFSLFERLHSFARSSLGNDALAEEAVQETFRIACMKPDAVCSSQNPKGWILNTLKYVISNIQKRQYTASKIISDCLIESPEILGAATDDLDLDLLYGNVANTEEFKLIKAIALDGKSMLELAKEQGISVAACKKRAQRAREYLRRRIKEK